MMRADLICVGDELLTGIVENSNSGYLARRLLSAGIPVREVHVVADEETAIGKALERASEFSDIVILTGGLGPTDDDLTKEAVANHLNLPLELDHDLLNQLERFFEKRGIKMPNNNRKQAMVIKGSTLLENKRGTAPGAMIYRDGKFIFLLPGPPYEMQPMFNELVLPSLVTCIKGNITTVKTLKCFGLGESFLEEKIKSLGPWDSTKISYIAQGYEVQLQLKAEGSLGETIDILSRVENRLRDALGDCIYGSDEETLVERVAKLFMQNNLTLALAESCSGGSLADTITDIPGSSNYFKGSIVAYDRSAKIKLLGIDPFLLDREGLVSASTATAMASSARIILDADIGVGITGIAGPESDLSQTPVGRVYVAAVSSKSCECKKLNLTGGRRTIKDKTVQEALNMLLKLISTR